MLSSRLLQKLKDDPFIADLGGQRAQVSVFVSDIEGFTAISEKLSSQQTVSLLNAYLDPAAKIILDNEGFIDKFVRDAIMAVWGVPYPVQNYAEKACVAALQIQQMLSTINPILQNKYGISLRVQMGIGSGEVLAALTGSEERKSYTVIGDRVNIASRLEASNKEYGTNILLCEKTNEMVESVLVTRCIDRVILKGKSVPILTYELIGKKTEIPIRVQQACKEFEQALHAAWDKK